MKTYPTNQILKNKIAIITGAGSGIGKCMVERFVQEGAQCLAADLNQDLSLIHISEPTRH